MIPIRAEWQAVTDVGAVRKLNEDRYFASDELGTWIVADGMGGLERGDWASTQVVEAVAGIGYDPSVAAMVERTRAALEMANERILAEAEQAGKQMGSTAVVLIIRERAFAVAWVGDSRAYLLRGNRLYRLTRDHSQVQELIDHGVIDETAAATHPLRNVLTRAVGVARPLVMDSITDTLQDEDLLLLCSDGLYGVIGEQEMEATLASQPFERAARIMVERCHELGAPDNITLIGVSTCEVTLVHYGAAGPEA
ncbi:protein phosphatase/serine/threonine protein phosphatase Stp1 [Novosphingobium sp. CF614]|uniref:PP2C family protein-serine/threonine phosphatase n=1 Tax=Novosphingobium sp. CF614 TaxID=1884364 RepID=UPI0008E193DA|nr:protein phosphatase 2C domain-containing protein [Novosphingobium sp. CF614]SFG05376.1 protein phosphatase/serine/threonine protein phosphatase Stp1 [Novosphingobium sp. CF614]